jgi:riboflavin synthase
MFTGIVTDIGEVRAVEARGDKRFVIGCAYPASSIAIGASICCSGICLTVTDKGTDAHGDWFAVDASAETCSLTTAAGWETGTKLNLERALKVGDELGGHIVTGHVDGLGHLRESHQDGDSWRYTFEAPSALSQFIAAKGSITVDGVSLTVNAVDDTSFGINLIPHTQAETTLGGLAAGHAVNLEIDVLARYVARLNDVREAALSKGS